MCLWVSYKKKYGKILKHVLINMEDCGILKLESEQNTGAGCGHG
jgi:hypothetical protein